MRFAFRFALVAVMLASVGCTKQKPGTSIIVPTSATSDPEFRGDGTIPTQRYVVRMSDGERDWEVEFPESATGYEMRIPLQGQQKTDRLVWESEDLTDADRELLRQMRRDNPALAREGVFAGGDNLNDPEGQNELGGLVPGAELDERGNPVRDPGAVSLDESQPQPTRPSYLLGVEEVQRLFKSGHYELAMVRLRQLESAYPNDAKILAMKGTLWAKLGRKELAREAWEQVLQIDPQNRAVLEAIKRLD